MTVHSHALLLALISLASTSVAVAQTPPDSTAPSAASSPHQRDSTSTPAAEAPAASGAEPADAATPHQKQATAGKTAMKDCMAKQQAKDSSLSKDQLKKACTAEMKKQ